MTGQPARPTPPPSTSELAPIACVFRTIDRQFYGSEALDALGFHTTEGEVQMLGAKENLRGHDLRRIADMVDQLVESADASNRRGADPQ